METFKLSFCKIFKLSESIAEVIVFDGIEIDLSMVQEYHKWISDNLENPCGLLVNRKNKYAYTFKAQIKIMNFKQIKAVAVVNYSAISEVATTNMYNLSHKNKWNLKNFGQTQEALKWLKNELE